MQGRWDHLPVNIIGCVRRRKVAEAINNQLSFKTACIQRSKDDTKFVFSMLASIQILCFIVKMLLH